MKNLLRIARWEFKSRFRSRPFLFNTFISPFLFVILLTLPIYFFHYQPEVSTKLVGVIDLTGEKIAGDLQQELNRYYRLKNQSPEYMILNVSVNNSRAYIQKQAEFNEILSRQDSLNALYNQIKDERTAYYKNTKTRNRAFMLQSSYERLQKTREEKELVDIEATRFKATVDSLYEREARVMADSLLISNVLNAYLVFSGNFTKTGNMEHHSQNPGDFLDTERLDKILQNIIIKKRITDDNIDNNTVAKWLKPVHIRKYQLFAKGQKEWNFYVQFYGPIIGVFLLFIAIFTTGGYLFSGVLSEKSNKVIEVLLSFASSRQIMAGKILGLGFLGLLQVFIWFGMTALIMSSGILPNQDISYLNLEHALYFLLYFSLGFLFYGSVFITVGSFFTTEYDAQQVNQFLRAIAVFPIFLSLLVLAEPNSLFIRTLSYIPIFTPSFMILRIPLSSTAITTDIYITTGIMVVSILFILFIAGRIFRMATLMQGKKPSWNEIFRWIRFS